MKKIVLSWVAIETDFDRKTGKVSESGPNLGLHNSLNYAFDIHYLIYAKKSDEEKAFLLRNKFEADFKKHNVNLIFADITNIYDIAEIKGKLENILLDLKNSENYVYTPPGTKQMFAAWFLLAGEKHSKIKLIHMKDPNYIVGTNNKWYELEVTKSDIKNFIINDKANKEETSKGLFIPDSLKTIYDKAAEIGQTDGVTFLISGESGTGKERLAKYFHYNSTRKGKIFQTVNCASLNDQILTSELFGHVKGAYTDAKEEKVGYFAAAKGGTIFLDEIGEISPKMQISLLRILQTKEFQKMGATVTEYADVNVVLATNKNLWEECRKGTFREDLYWRIIPISLELPPVKEIGTKGIMELFDFFLEKFSKNYERDILKLDNNVRKMIGEYSFPGNIRELEGLANNFYVTNFNKKVITIDCIPKWFIQQINSSANSFSLKDMEKSHILKLLIKNNYNQTETFKMLGISRNTLKSKMIEYNIIIPKY